MKRTKMSILFLLTIFLISLFQVSVPGQKPVATSGVRRASTPSSRSRVSLIGMQKPGPPFDRFKALKSDDEKTRLDYFSSELRRDPTLSGYIVVYGKRDGPASEAKKRAENAKNYLLYKRLVKNPLVTIDYCTRDEVEYELYIVPEGKTPVFCSKPR